MSVRHLMTAGAVTAAWLTIGLASPASAVVCDAYSGACPSTPPTAGPVDLGGGTENPGSGSENPGTSTGGTSGGASGGGASGGVTGSTSTSPSTLPFTGGELVLMTAIGAGALAGGTVLVIAGRRRTQFPA